MSKTCTCAKVRRSSRTLTALYDAALARHALSTVQFSILRTLARLGPTTTGALAEITGHERSSLSRIVKPLAERDLVTFETADDRREKPLTLTPDGERLLSAALPCWQAAQDRIDDVLGPDRSAFNSLLERLEELRT